MAALPGTTRLPFKYIQIAKDLQRSNGIWSDFDSCTPCWWGAEVHGSCSVLASLNGSAIVEHYCTWITTKMRFLREGTKTKEEIRLNKHPQSSSFWAWNLWPVSTPMATVSEQLSAQLFTAPRSKTSTQSWMHWDLHVRSNIMIVSVIRLRQMPEESCGRITQGLYHEELWWRLWWRVPLQKQKLCNESYYLIIPCRSGIKR